MSDRLYNPASVDLETWPEITVDELFAADRRRRKRDWQRRSLELALLLGYEVEECEYGYLIRDPDE